MASSCSMCCSIMPAFPTASIKHGEQNITWAHLCPVQQWRP